MNYTTTTDIAVIGLGAMGSGALWRLAGRGANVAGFEQYAPGHDLGSSHGETRINRTSYFEDPRYVPLVRRAFDLWSELERATGVDLLVRSGALMIGQPGGELVEGTLASVREHGLEHEVLDAEQMARRYPQHKLLPGEVAVYEEAAGVLRPEAAIRAAVDRAEQLGARVFRNTSVERIEAGTDGVTVHYSGGTLRARHAVVAVGAWLPSFLPELDLPLVVERQISAWFATEDAARFGPARYPVFIRTIEPDHNYYGLPALTDGLIKLGVHHEGANTNPSDVDRAIHPADLAPLQDYVGNFLSGVDPTAVRAKVCLYTNTPDEHFILGAAPGLPNVTLVGGCSGHSFKFATVMGDAAADLALTGETDYPIALFDPARFRPAR